MKIEKLMFKVGLIVLVSVVAFAGVRPQQEWRPTKAWLQKHPRYFWQPANGFVESKETAIAIGTAVLTQILGRKAVIDAGKLDAVRIDDVWVVFSQPPVDEKGNLAAGGIVTVQIDNTTGTIINLTQSL